MDPRYSETRVLDVKEHGRRSSLFGISTFPFTYERSSRVDNETQLYLENHPRAQKEREKKTSSTLDALL